MMQIEENKPLAPLTTFGVGGPARWFVSAVSEAELLEAVTWARQRGAYLFVLGGGSNLIVSDSGFPGLVVHVALRGVRATGDGPFMIYEVAAGEDWDQFVQRTVDDGCAGVECLAGIPGTVGGTPVQNVGAYGQEVSSTIETVRVFDLRERVFHSIANPECGFGYRKSRFNTVDRNRYLVTQVTYRLTRGGAAVVKYPELKLALDTVTPAGVDPTLAEVAAAVRRLRQNKGMLLVDNDPNCKSAGSFFKNPIVTVAKAAEIAQKCGAEAPRFPVSMDGETAELVKVPAAWLIEQAGFAKGYRQGAAGISTRHTLALVNLGGATAQEILALAAHITETVEGKFGVQLEQEPVLVGFD
jgi:UDP-N-acetylmuramate dehydrogenase